MDDVGPVLERIRDRFIPREDSLPRLLERARRRQRNRRLGTALFALAVFAAAAAGLWAGFKSAPPAPAGPMELPMEGAFDVAVGEGAVWVARYTSDDPSDFVGEIMRIDPSTGRVQARIPLEQVGPIAVGDGAVWVATYPTKDTPATVMKIDPSTNSGYSIVLPNLEYQVAPGDRAFLPDDVAVGFGRIWISTARGTVVSLDAETDDVATQSGDVHKSFDGLAVGAGSVWTWNSFVPPESAALRIDPTSGQIDERDGAPAVIASVAADERYVWISHEPVEQIAPGCTANTPACGPTTYALLRLEPAANTRSVSNRWPKIPGVLAASGGVAYLGDRLGTVWAVDDLGGRRLRDLGTPIRALAVDGGTLWVVTADGLVGLALKTESTTPGP